MKYLNETYRIEILMIIGYGDHCRSQVEVANLFNQTYTQLPSMSQGTVSKIHAQFRELGHVKPSQTKPHFIVDDVKVDVLLSVQENPMTSARQIAHQNTVSHTTVFSQSKLTRYKMSFCQELIEDDPDRKMEFCEQLRNKIDKNEIALGSIMISEQSSLDARKSYSVYSES